MKPDDVRPFTGVSIPPPQHARAKVSESAQAKASEKAAISQVEDDSVDKRTIHHEKTDSGLSVIKISNQRGEVIREIPHEVVQKLHSYLQTNDLLPEPGQHIDKKS